MNGSITIGFEHQPPTKQAYAELQRVAGGTDIVQEEQAWKSILDQSRCTVSAYDNGQLIGFGRVSLEDSTGITNSMVSLVDPTYAHKGVDQTIRKLLQAECFTERLAVQKSSR
ncbi:hypothetical protein SY83_22515 [Paenibacillus swuensis]|uniref:N-acetyltransferase domain-containing protein n=1 Tax=Paenibacillus swuensis TaxID=1178515 RepID=A0A172TNH0_9BACL|nr:GNAT family N-acetyltransferase [Paenibacillus swuensis]ANE48601.1 hypothetical protein SY83_22515 [Paenibacillus swuensis]